MKIDSKTRNIILSTVVALIVLLIGVALWRQSRTAAPEAMSIDVTPQAGATVETTATPAASVTATLAPDTEEQTAASPSPDSCTNNAAFAGDVTLPDGAEVQPDTATVKTWRIRNTGTCTWGGDYQLRFAGGDQLGGPDSMAIGTEVAPGAEFNAEIPLVSAADAGRYQGQWIMADPVGNSFGQVVYYEIVVPGTPAIAYFKASQYWVSPGQQVTLSWDLAKAYDGAFLREVALDGTTGAEQGVVAPGSTVVTPEKTISYDLIARNDQGESMRRLTIMVAPADATATPLPGADQLPVISYFRADRYEITAGEQAILSWDLSGAESAFLVIDGAEEGVTAPSVRAVSPEQTTIYRLVARNAAGELAQEVTVVVADAAEAPPAAELTPTNTPAGEQAATPVPEEPTPTPEAPATEPTPTVEPVEEAEPTPTDAPAEEAPAEPAATARNADTAILTTPDGTSEQVALVDAGQQMAVLGRSEDSAWLQVTLDDGSTGWVAADQVDVSVDVATLPVATP